MSYELISAKMIRWLYYNSDMLIIFMALLVCGAIIRIVINFAEHMDRREIDKQTRNWD